MLRACVRVFFGAKIFAFKHRWIWKFNTTVFGTCGAYKQDDVGTSDCERENVAWIGIQSEKEEEIK